MIPRARGKGCGSGLDAAIVREYLELGECVRVARCAGVDSCNGSLVCVRELLRCSVCVCELLRCSECARAAWRVLARSVALRDCVGLCGYSRN